MARIPIVAYTIPVQFARVPQITWVARQTVAPNVWFIPIVLEIWLVSMRNAVIPAKAPVVQMPNVVFCHTYHDAHVPLATLVIHLPVVIAKCYVSRSIYTTLFDLTC